MGGFKGCFEKEGQTHEIAATGNVKMSAISNKCGKPLYVYLFRFRLLCRNARCQRTITETSDRAQVFGPIHLNQAV